MSRSMEPGCLAGPSQAGVTVTQWVPDLVCLTLPERWGWQSVPSSLRSIVGNNLFISANIYELLWLHGCTCVW